MTRPEETPAEPRVKRLDILGFNPLDHIPLRRAFLLAKELGLEELMGLLLYYGSHTHANTNRIAKEVHQMQEQMQEQIQDQIEAMAGEISAQIVEFTAAYTKIGVGIEAEVVHARSRLTVDSDPEVWIALRRISDLVLAMKRCETNVRGAMAKADAGIGPVEAMRPAMTPAMTPAEVTVEDCTVPLRSTLSREERA